MKYILSFALVFISITRLLEATVMENFEDATKLSFINNQFAVASMDGSAVHIDTSSAKNTNAVFSTAVGLLKAGKEYTVSLRYTLDNPDYTKLVNMNLYVTAGDKKLASRHLYASKKTSFEKMTFSVPSDANDAAITLETKGAFKAKIKNFKIQEGRDETFLPATPDAKTYEEELKNLPTGAIDFTVELPKPATEVIINVADFGASEKNPDNTLAFNKALEACREKKASKLIVPKGVYHFKTEVSIDIKGLTDFTFDGGGSLFRFRRNEDVGAYVNIEDCLRTKVGNFSVDHDWDDMPLATVGEVVGHGESPSSKSFAGNQFKYYVDFKLVDYKKYPWYGKQIRVACIDPFDINARAVSVENAVKPVYIGLAPKHKGTLVEWVSPNVIRVYLISAVANRFANSKHKFYRLQHYYYGVGGLRVSSNKHLTLENINVFSCKGHGLLCTGNQQYWQMINVKIAAPKDDIKRVVSSTSDLIHFARSMGYFKMLSCQLSDGSDDCINIHDGTIFAMWHSPNSIKLKPRGGNTPEVGDKIELRHSNLSSTGFKGKVVKVNPLKNNHVEVVFAEKIPEPKFDAYVLFNRKFDSSNVIIKDTLFSKNRARAALILTSNVTIENCAFEHIPMGAIRIETGYTWKGWCEGYGVDNVVVKNCTFESSNVSEVTFNDIPFDVSMYAYMGRYEKPEQPNKPILSNILFENNTFKNSFGGVALISAAKNVIFRNNKIQNTLSRETPNPFRGVFYVRNSRDVKIINNTWETSAVPEKAGVIYDHNTVKSIVIEGNLKK